MAPDEDVVKDIGNLLISTTESGVQDNKSLLDAYTYFNECIHEKGIQKPVVVLSDGHSSRFNADVMQYLRDNDINLFIGPPDTTGVTQLLDQINQSLHHQYRLHKKGLFTPNSTINREGFMRIMAKMWGTWAQSQAIVKAAKRVGISEEGLDVDWIQADKFLQADLCIEKETEMLASTPNASLISSPINIRKGTTKYYKYKYEQAHAKLVDIRGGSRIFFDPVEIYFLRSKK